MIAEARGSAGIGRGKVGPEDREPRGPAGTVAARRESASRTESGAVDRRANAPTGQRPSTRHVLAATAVPGQVATVGPGPVLFGAPNGRGGPPENPPAAPVRRRPVRPRRDRSGSRPATPTVRRCSTA